MLGRQFQVIAIDEDLARIEEALLARGDVEFLSSNTSEARNALLPLRSLRVAESPPGPTRLTCYLVPAHRPRNVRVEPVSDVKVHVAVESSEIIEFGRSYCDKGRVKGDRIYYTPRYFDADGFHDKDPEFVRWAERVAATVKKVLRYDKSLMAQVGPDAAAKIASGELRVIS